jgi:hypothetical protein
MYQEPEREGADFPPFLIPRMEAADTPLGRAQINVL